MNDENKSSENILYYRAWENLKEEKLDGSKILRLPDHITKSLEKKHYGVYGHSAVQICGWTKKSLTGKGVCYKEKFYGIECHNCMEFSPAVMWCQQNCSFCWRPMEFMKNIEINENEVDDFKDIVDNLLIKRRKLLSGFGGHPTVDMKKLKEANDPTHYAISLSGEPTMYPHLDKIVEYLKTIPKTKSIFIVTNAQIPEFFEKLEKNTNALPTQLYISLDSPNEAVFKKVNMSLYKDAWQRLHKSLEIFSKLQTRRLLRFTLIKGVNDLEEQFCGYQKLIEIGKPDFLELKGFVYIGMARKRHTKEQSPTYLEVESYAQKLADYLGNYTYVTSAPNSLICLLKRNDSKYEIKLDIFKDIK